jgi:hypothetical protein
VVGAEPFLLVKPEVATAVARDTFWKDKQKEKRLGSENRASGMLLTLENELEADQQLACVAGKCHPRIVEVRFVRNEVVFLRRTSHAVI